MEKLPWGNQACMLAPLTNTPHAMAPTPTLPAHPMSSVPGPLGIQRVRCRLPRSFRAQRSAVTTRNAARKVPACTAGRRSSYICFACHAEFTSAKQKHIRACSKLLPKEQLQGGVPLLDGLHPCSPSFSHPRRTGCRASGVSSAAVTVPSSPDSACRTSAAQQRP